MFLDINEVTDLPAAEVEILHPVTGQLTGAGITLIGPEHERRRALEFRQARRLRQRLTEGAAEDDDGEAGRADWIDHLAACTEGWRGIKRDGQAIEFSRAAARDLYTQVGWLREQVGRALNNRALFIGSSASSSSTGPSINSD